MYIGYLFVIKGKEYFLNIMGIGVINFKFDLFVIQLNYYIFVFYWFVLFIENYVINVLNVYVYIVCVFKEKERKKLFNVKEENILLIFFFNKWLGGL